MDYLARKPANINGMDIPLSGLDSAYVNREIYITGTIDEECATIINSELRSLARDSDEDITVYIQSRSPDGSVTAGLSIYDTVKALSCDVCTVACGAVASMSAILFAAAGTKGKRWIQPSAKVLIHQPHGGSSGQATDIRIAAEDILKSREMLNRILSESTGQPVEKIQMDTERDYILYAAEALEYGLADKIGEPK